MLLSAPAPEKPLHRFKLIGICALLLGTVGVGLTLAGSTPPSKAPIGTSRVARPEPPALSTARSGEFVALTYNVAGLPEVLSRSKPSVYTPLIGERLNGYDLVLLQESWQTPEPNPAAPLRCYHELLLETAQHAYKSPSAPQPFGDDPRRPSALLADGLNVFSKLPLETTIRMPWSTCVETFNDCYALKGFSMTPLRLAQGASVHVYNLHMEAGWSDADDEARAAAVDQLLAFIDLHSRGEALIVGGDFNLRGERKASATLLAKLRERAGLSDACVRCERPGNVDKVLYRSGNELQLDADGWRLERKAFQTESGEPLSDHVPLSVRFTWSKRQDAVMPSPLELR